MGMDLGSAGGKPGRASPSMNVTPLVDVVLVLLIIFMVITPLLAKQFWIHLPDKKEKEEQPPPSPNDKPPIVVFVNEKGEIEVNHEIISKADFPHKLKRMIAGSGGRTIFFDAAEDAPFGSAVDVLDLSRGGGAATIAVLTESVAPKAE